MDIICASCGQHFDNVASARMHNEECKGVQLPQWSASSSNKKTPQYIFPPSIPYPQHLLNDKPFLGAFKDSEIKLDEDRYCSLCNTKGVIGHIQQFGLAVMIDAFWCSNCKIALWENQTHT